MRVLLPPDRGEVRGSARAALLSDWMSSWLETRVRVDLASSYRALVEEVQRGRAELAWAPPAVCARLRSEAQALLTVVRYGARQCRSAFVVHRNNLCRNVEGLSGARAAWVDPLSTSGYLMALSHLMEQDLHPDELFSEQRFAGSYRGALAAVAEGRADVTAVFVVDEDAELTLRELYDLVGPSASALRLLAMTDPAPFDALVVGPEVPEAEALIERLLKLHNRMNPPSMLLEVCRADRFVRGDVEDYARFERLVLDG